MVWFCLVFWREEVVVPSLVFFKPFRLQAQIGSAHPPSFGVQRGTWTQGSALPRRKHRGSVQSPGHPGQAHWKAALLQRAGSLGI